MNIQKINVKLFTDAPAEPDLTPFLAIFSRWREDRADPAGWVDLADYAHVPRGPGVMLIGHQGNLSADLADPGPGLLWCNRNSLEGPLEDRLREVFRRSVVYFARLRAEAGYPPDLEPRPGFWEVTVNDRLMGPNTEETDRGVRPVVDGLGARLFGSGGYTLLGPPEAPARYSLTLHSDAAGSLAEVAAKLSASA
jgi:hypothetical protein